MLERVRIILSHTSHPGNIGASARAMQNMGLNELYLVAPKLFPDPEATTRAKHATAILEQAVVTEDIDAALEQCTLVFGTTARDSSLGMPVLTPEAAMHLVAKTKKAAVLFGAERTGLTKMELQRCNYIISIPTSGAYISLNLAQAVQIICYEYCKNYQELSLSNEKCVVDIATADQLADFYSSLEQILIAIDMLNPSVPKTLMQRMRELFNRANITGVELSMLRGMLTAINRKLEDD
ncbi:MAG: tRNA (cytosine(32)/uridine(32)-2'-O)-methyltransferase TrmJ [Legionellales bacterium]|nr:MAG: tRNA (cytosine(32)/uridine(32)-2'-O)-methyltransferase TrmJ [Legionellales bacterium]